VCVVELCEFSAVRSFLLRIVAVAAVAVVVVVVDCQAENSKQIVQSCHYNMFQIHSISLKSKEKKTFSFSILFSIEQYVILLHYAVNLVSAINLNNQLVWGKCIIPDLINNIIQVLSCFVLNNQMG